LDHPPAVPAKNIVVAVDGSPPSRDAGRYAVALTKALGARLQIVHVVDYSGLIAASAGAGTAWTAMLPSMQEDARTLVGLTVREAERAGVAHTVHIIEGSEPAAGVAAHAKAHGADLIILGSHGRTGLSRALLGSVAERVVRFAPCPVLIYR
jgi:nucleotide-binding universal stress UspA family protein